MTENFIPEGEFQAQSIGGDQADGKNDLIDGDTIVLEGLRGESSMTQLGRVD